MQAKFHEVRVPYNQLRLDTTCSMLSARGPLLPWPSSQSAGTDDKRKHVPEHSSRRVVPCRQCLHRALGRFSLASGFWPLPCSARRNLELPNNQGGHKAERCAAAGVDVSSRGWCSGPCLHVLMAGKSHLV